jgi:phage terminase large subunit GpA-like protein
MDSAIRKATIGRERQRLWRFLTRRAERNFRKPPPMTLIEWADRERFIPAGKSATPGKWHTSEQPVGFGLMAAITDRGTHTVTGMCATQVIKTETLFNYLGYTICVDPAAILVVTPTQDSAQVFSRRFAATVAATPALRALIDVKKYRNPENTITHITAAGGTEIDFAGANSSTDLSARPKRIILCDEIDKYPLSAGVEGDPLALAEERASTYKAVGRAKFIRMCSPTVEGSSRIGREYAASDQRQCFVACIRLRV